MNSHHVMIDAQGPALIEPLAKIAEQSGFAVSRAGDTVQIDALLGQAVLKDASEGTRLTLQTSSPAELHLFVDI